MTASTTEFRQLEESIEIDASPAQVWALVTDVARMASWSPQVVKSFVSGPVQLGTRFRNVNRRGLLVWPTSAKVVRFEPHTDFAFRVRDNLTIWSFALEPTATGTRVTQRREVPDGISSISVKLTKLAFGGQDSFGDELSEGMRQTLTKIKATAEAR